MISRQDAKTPSPPTSSLLGIVAAWLLLIVAMLGAPAVAALPNFVVIFIDDLGYADIGPFGCDAYPTPHLDRMAAEGMKLTDFHSATAVCSASRAALMTGCYAERVGIQGALFPGSRIGLSKRRSRRGRRSPTLSRR